MSRTRGAISPMPQQFHQPNNDILVSSRPTRLQQGHQGMGNVSATLLSFMISTLKFETLSKFSTTISKPRLINTGQEGFQCSELTVRQKCDMSTFLDLVTTFKSELQLPGSSVERTQRYRLNPSSRSFMNPSRATQSLSIDFQSLQQLLYCLEIKDSRDHFSAGFRSSRRKGNGMVRVLGSACVITLHSLGGSNSSLDIDCVLPFVSHTAIQVDQIQSCLRQALTGSDSTGACEHTSSNPTCCILYRVRKDYDEVKAAIYRSGNL